MSGRPRRAGRWPRWSAGRRCGRGTGRLCRPLPLSPRRPAAGRRWPVPARSARRLARGRGGLSFPGLLSAAVWPGAEGGQVICPPAGPPDRVVEVLAGAPQVELPGLVEQAGGGEGFLQPGDRRRAGLERLVEVVTGVLAGGAFGERGLALFLAFPVGVVSAGQDEMLAGVARLAEGAVGAAGDRLERAQAVLDGDDGEVDQQPGGRVLDFLGGQQDDLAGRGAAGA